ncbi:MAG TPA: DUF3810 domain-containing protein [Candidatus Scatomorpha intestinigallinarum]|jgi:hypothetical protein|uniref:DUF3810 domain-containing protein n=1 Tax=Candidatus Scatomorpha intestinigallinarum TaxID=2840923 RepID=A0A9D1IZD5_9FIRM|nr:DUF3810 domain-containing protein [Candidatus Scatomorpha intestinigallinarum]
MEKTAHKKNLRRLAPVRLGITLLCLLAVALIYALRVDEGAMLWVYEHVTHPYHLFMSKLCSHFAFSAAELVYAAAILGLAAYLLWCVYRLIRFPEKLWQLYRLVLTLAMAGAVFWAGLSVMWTPCYYAPGFAEQSGVDDGPLELEELETVTRWFAALASEYADEVPRDENGACTTDRDSVLDRAAGVFEGAAELYPFLDGEALRPKPIHFSRIMSYLDFTGFFFPMTGEANLNMDSPVFLLPSTSQHEIAHQRGVAMEQECNFVAVLSCLESEYADFRYAGAALAYIYLGNALAGADYEAYTEIYYSLSDTVRADFKAQSAYWDEFRDSAAQKASNTVYDSFLKSNGQELGMQSYGACVNLLVHYYIDEAREALG